jgi:hypothetical protein
VGADVAPVELCVEAEQVQEVLRAGHDPAPQEQAGEAQSAGGAGSGCRGEFLRVDVARGAEAVDEVGQAGIE